MTSSYAWGRVAIGIGILALGVFWLTAILRAEHSSSTIQHGVRTIAVVEARRFIAPCANNVTCQQTVYTVRYAVGPTPYRAQALADGWDEKHPVGSRMTIVYAPNSPGSVEIAGEAPSRIVPTIGAVFALVTGTLVAAAWGYVIIRDRKGE